MDDDTPLLKLVLNTCIEISLTPRFQQLSPRVSWISGVSAIKHSVICASFILGKEFEIVTVSFFFNLSILSPRILSISVVVCFNVKSQYNSESSENSKNQVKLELE